MNKKIIFFGGGSDLALNLAKNLTNCDIFSISRKKNNIYKKNILVKNYSDKELNKGLSKLNETFDFIIIFNGIFNFSILSNFNEKKFIDVLRSNVIVPLNIVNKIIKNNLLKKNSNIFFLSSNASIKPEIGNAYYSISKNILNFSSKILNKENKKRMFKFNIISLGIIDNKMGREAKTLINFKKKKLSRPDISSKKNLIIYIKQILKNPKKIKFLKYIN